jgi:hypothetical protein
MEKLLHMLPEKMRNNIGRRIAEHRQSSCERLTEKAAVLNFFGRYEAAAVYYGAASKKAMLLGDGQKAAMLLLRKSESIEDHGIRLREEASEEETELSRAKKLIKAANSFICAAVITHRLGDSAFKAKEKRLLMQAGDSINRVHELYASLTIKTYNYLEMLEIRWDVDYNSQHGYKFMHR